MAPITILGRPPAVQANPRRNDEELINRSLLESLNAQADAEPLSSSDSEAPPSSREYGSPASSSITSPSIPFSFDSLGRARSPPGLFQHHLAGQPMYNMHSADITSPLSDNGTPRGLTSPTFRNTATYPSFANGRARQGSAAATTTFRGGEPFNNFYSGNDTYASRAVQPQLVQGPVPQRQSFDALRGSNTPYELPTSPPLVSANGGSFAGVDPFGSAVLQGHPSIVKPTLSVGPRQQQSQQHGPAFHGPSQAPHSAMSQTPFGPHLPAGGGVPTVSAPPMGTVTSTGSATSQEEISTIFVVGFPDDMSEREFQNMFTFSPGFEAATLKIPNKELTSYGNAQNGQRANGFQAPYGGSHDPYNLVTVNQGGVLVDNGRDGPTTSWQAHGGDDSHFGGGNGPNLPPRKQIIGFAKFRSRQEALEAREVLQGRRVDAEKGAVLKAEMAKKNLHTKRGVGQPGLPNIGGGVSTDVLQGLGGLPHTMAPGGEALTAREKELGALGAMGFGQYPRRSGAMSESEDERPHHIIGTRGARERAEDAERQAARRREKELRSHNSSAFDAFHSVPQQLARGAPTNSLLASGAMDETPSFANFGMPPGLPAREAFGPAATAWVSSTSGGPVRRVPSSLDGIASDLMHITESGHCSPHADEFGSGPPSTTSQDGFDSDTSCNADAGFNDPPAPTMVSSSLHAFRARALSPTAEQQYATTHPTHSASSASSASGSSQIGQREEQLGGAMAALAISTQRGEISPQMTSPVSNSSGASAPKPNVADQNPPINTLYVGNLPSSPMLQYTNQLEESLKALFSHCQGFRKLCFRQKANGPMCFVEFEDVSFATKALNDLYGHTLDGLVKNGGIRLSYSKNPLGVRTPTGASSGYAQGGACETGYIDGLPRDSDPIMPAGRREAPAVTSPTSAYHYSLSPPPPRFFSSSPSAGFGPAPAPISSTAFPRANPQGYSLPPSGSHSSSTSAFSPFGLPAPARMTEQPNTSDDHFTRTLPPLTT